jgi:5-deoxy-glucuronate isomerase
MTETHGPLLVRTHAPDHGVIVSISREQARWQYISFLAWALAQGERVEDSTGDEEIGLVVLSGHVTVESSEGTWRDIGDRDSVFDGPPFVVYLPPGTRFTLTGETGTVVARAGVRATTGVEAYLITPDDITIEERGQANATRSIRHILEADRPAERLFLVECITPPGNWSSYPPHKHDTDRYPDETYLEETYYHRINPSTGFGFQRVYTPDRGMDEAMVIEDGTLVLVPRGYHPVVFAPGYEGYYLNVMAGPIREWRFADDPDHAWVGRSWAQYGAQPR